MLNPTEVHLLVGFMVKAHSQDAVDIELGARCADEAAEEDRDVDIAITCKRGPEDLLVVRGIEVKKHSRPLTVEQVEQLCGKFADISSVREKCIVSASGYTAGARRKARAHGVELLEMRPWDSKTGWKGGHSIDPDLPFRFISYSWVGIPNVRFESDATATNGQAEISSVSRVYNAAGEALGIAMNVDGLAGAMALQVLNAHNPPLKSPEDQPVEADLQVPVDFDQELFVEVAARRLRLTGALVTGRVRPHVEQVKGKCYSLKKVGEDVPMVGCVLSVAPDDSILGLMIADGSLSITVIRIPLQERLLKKIRARTIHRKS